MMLIMMLFACSCCFARGRVISRVAVRGDSSLPAIPLESEAAVKICTASRRSPLLLRWAWQRQRDKLCEDAKLAYLNQGYLVNIRPPTALFDGGSLLVLEARSLASARPAVVLRGVGGKKLRTRPETVAKALGLKPGRPFHLDESKWRRLSALFHSAKPVASVVGDEVTYALDDVKERYSRSLIPEVEVDAKGARATFKFTDSNFAGRALEATAEAQLTPPIDGMRFETTLSNAPLGGRLLWEAVLAGGKKELPHCGLRLGAPRGRRLTEQHPVAARVQFHLDDFEGEWSRAAETSSEWRYAKHNVVAARLSVEPGTRRRRKGPQLAQLGLAHGWELPFGTFRLESTQFCTFKGGDFSEVSPVVEKQPGAVGLRLDWPAPREVPLRGDTLGYTLRLRKQLRPDLDGSVFTKSTSRSPNGPVYGAALETSGLRVQLDLSRDTRPTLSFGLRGPRPLQVQAS